MSSAQGQSGRQVEGLQQDMYHAFGSVQLVCFYTQKRLTQKQQAHLLQQSLCRLQSSHMQNIHSLFAVL